MSQYKKVQHLSVIDWYREYVSVNHTNCELWHTDVFPVITVDMEKVHSVLTEKIWGDHAQKKYEKLNEALLRSLLVAEAHGITGGATKLQSCHGETIHCDIQSI